MSTGHDKASLRAAVIEMSDANVARRVIAARLGTTEKTVRVILSGAWDYLLSPTITATADQQWRTRAACASAIDDAKFFPDAGGSAVAAKRICAGCPVRGDCLEFALSCDDSLGGVWGGKSHDQLADLRKQRVSAGQEAA